MLVTLATNDSLLAVKRCSVVFSVTLRLLVINISSSSPAINTAAYYQRCVITCETVAVHQRPRLQHRPVAALTQAVKPDIGSESRSYPTSPGVHFLSTGLLQLPAVRSDRQTHAAITVGAECCGKADHRSQTSRTHHTDIASTSLAAGQTTS